MTELYNYILDQFPTALTTHFVDDMLQNILSESEKLKVYRNDVNGWIR